MKVPGPDHPITLTPCPTRIRVLHDGHPVADTEAAIRLQEASYPPVYYIPRDDVVMGFFGKTRRVSECPYKGTASYYSLNIGGDVIEDAAWSYETPYPAMLPIAGYLAFYPDKVTIEEVG